jgi:hypothetical protein
MSTFYLINTIKNSAGYMKSGKLIDDAITPTGPITSAGGLLVTSADATVAAAALVVQQMWNQGNGQSECDAVMLAAYEASQASYEAAHDSVVAQTLYISGYSVFNKPLAAELISVFADATMAAGALAIIANHPNTPCKLQVRLTCIGGITAGTVTLVGIGADGAAITQVIPLTGVTCTVITNDAYATLTSATISANLAGNVAGDHISIGVGSALGLPVPASCTSLSVYKETVDSVNETVGTVDGVARTVAPTTAANGTHVYEFWYRYAFQHTHALS